MCDSAEGIVKSKAVYKLSVIVLGCATLCRAGADDGIFGGASPILTGTVGFKADIANRQNLTLGPKFEPILLLPLGSKFLLETEYSTELPVTREDGIMGPAVYRHGFEYLQLNYLATSNVIVTGGHFVTPFGIYKERLDPQWVRNILTEPLIFAINDNSSLGGMVRATGYLAPGAKISATAYLSGNSTNTQLESERSSGGRVSLLLTGPGLEMGASFSRRLGDDRFNLYGADLVWNARRTPLDVRGEYVHAARLGSGYWFEGAYRLNKLSGNGFLRKSQLVARGEQYFAPGESQDINEDIPQLSTRRATVGWNYWPNNQVKLAFSFGRQSDVTGSERVWTLGLIYHFTMGER
jgi:hypothetical protein